MMAFPQKKIEKYFGMIGIVSATLSIKETTCNVREGYKKGFGAAHKPSKTEALTNHASATGSKVNGGLLEHPYNPRTISAIVSNPP